MKMYFEQMKTPFRFVKPVLISKYTNLRQTIVVKSHYKAAISCVNLKRTSYGITNSPDAPQLITKSLNSLKLLKINIQIGECC